MQSSGKPSRTNNSRSQHPRQESTKDTCVNINKPSEASREKQMRTISGRNISGRSSVQNVSANDRSGRKDAAQTPASGGCAHVHSKSSSTSGRSAHVNISSLEDALLKLSSDKEHHVNNALIWIRSTLIKQRDGPWNFIKSGGLEKLFKILHGSNSKFHDISLSILGNIVTEDKTKLQVMRLDGIRLIIHVLKTSDVEQIQNRACRTLANLAQNPKCSQVIHNEGVLEDEETASNSANKCHKKGKSIFKVTAGRSRAGCSSTVENKRRDIERKAVNTTAASTCQNDVIQSTSVTSQSTIERIVELLEQTSNHECQQTYLRALRLLGDSPRHRDVITECQGVKVICACLKSSSSSVLLIALKTAAHFLHLTETEAAVWQFVNAEGSQALLSLAEHHNSSISSTAASVLITFTKHELLRPCLGNAGAIRYFIDHIKKRHSQPKDKFAHINAVCLFCKEVVNRTKIRNAGGLELFLQLLDSPDYFVLHYKLVSALVFFLYDDAGMDILLRNDLVRILMKLFRKCAKIDALDLQTVFLKHVIGNIEADDVNLESDTNLYRNLDNMNDTNQAAENMQSILESVKDRELVMSSDGPKKTEIDSNESALSADVTEKRNIKVSEGDKKQHQEDIEQVGEKNTRDNSVQLDEEDCSFNSKKSIPKYSIDSPTYKSISEWTFEGNESCPLNIFDAQRHIQASSPDELFPYNSPPHSSPYTPLSISPYHSPSRSLTSSPGRSISPAFSTSSRGNSPARSMSPCLSDHSAIHRSPSESALSDISVLSWSGCSPHRSRSISPMTLGSSPTSRPLSPLTLNSPPRSSASSTELLWWGFPPSQKVSQNLQFSDEEYETIDKPDVKMDLINRTIGIKRKRSEGSNDFEKEKVVPNEELGDEVLRCSQDTTYSSPLYTDPVFEQSMNTDFGKALRGESLLSQMSSESAREQTASHHREDIKHAEEGGEMDMHTETVHVYGSLTTHRNTKDEHDASSETKRHFHSKSESNVNMLEQKHDVTYLGKYKRRRSDRWSTTSIGAVHHERKTLCTNSEDATDVVHSDPRTDTESSIIEQSKRGSNSGKTNPCKSINPAKTTEDSILVVLSRLSYAEEPSGKLLCKDVLETLIVYLLCARRPFHRAERILHRLCTNAKCFGTIMKLNVPVILHLASVCQTTIDISDMFNDARNDRKGSDTIVGGNTDSENEAEKQEASSILDRTLTGEKDKLKPEKQLKINAKCCDALKDVLTQLNLVMTSEYGLGVVQHVMMSGSDVEKHTCALALPICCKDNELLTDYMVTYKGLNILLDLIFNSPEDDNAWVYSVHALHRLAVQTDMLMLHHGIGMHFKSPGFKSLERKPFDSFHMMTQASKDSSFRRKNAYHRCCKDQNSENYVSKLAYCRRKIYEASANRSTVSKSHYEGHVEKSDGNCVEFLVEEKVVHADREIMCAKSQFFSAMLRGHYAESEQSRVRIHDAPYRAFRIICDILHEENTSFCQLVASCIDLQRNKTPNEQLEIFKTGNRTSKVSAIGSTSGSITFNSHDVNITRPAIPDMDSSEGASFENKIPMGISTEESKHPEEVCLDVLRLADRFMLHDVIHDVTMTLYDHVVNADNVIRVLDFAICHHCTLLASRCVAFMTSQCISLTTRSTWYHELRQCPSSDDVMACFYDVITSHLPLKMSVCKLDK